MRCAELIPEHKRESWDATKKKLIVDESQREVKYRPISREGMGRQNAEKGEGCPSSANLKIQCHLKEILNQKYIESYENVIFIIGGDLMWAELKARLGLDAYICTGHICHLPLYHHICKILFFVKKYKQIIRLQKNCTLLASGHIYVILPFMMLKSPCTAIKHKINAIWAETFTHWMSVLIFIESKKRGKLIFLLM